jgi:hypothetical protein
MVQVKRTLTILNLAGELSTELQQYFASRSVRVVNPIQEEEVLEWTHILLGENSDPAVIQETFQTFENDIKLIALGTLNNVQEFVLNNGKMVFDQGWLKGPFGVFILDKFFQEYAGLNPDEKYPTFEEKGSFKIVNPFSTGESLDRLVAHAFDFGVNALGLKTYYDHLLMYLTGLKTMGRLGYPIEVTYGSCEDVFGLQFHFAIKDLTLEDVTASLADPGSWRAEEYLLNVSVRACDFFDFTYVQEVKKVVVTGLWSKSKELSFDNQGMMFTQVDGRAELKQFVTESLAAVIFDEPAVEDQSDKVLLPSIRPESERAQLVTGKTAEALEATTVKGRSSKAASSQKLAGSPEEEGSTEIVSSKEVQTLEEKQTITGEREMKERGKFVRAPKHHEKDITVVKGRIDVDTSFQRIAGTREEEEVAVTVRGSNSAAEDAERRQKFSSTSNAINTNQRGKLFPSSQEALAAGVPEDMLQEFLNLKTENESLRLKAKLLSTELRLAKDNLYRKSEADTQAAAAVEEKYQPRVDSDEEVRDLIQKKLADPKSVNEQDLTKIKGLMEREAKLIGELKIEEAKLKKLQIESAQKEVFYRQEIDKAQRGSTAKDFIVQKSKETLTQVLEKRDVEMASITKKLDAANKILANGGGQGQTIQVRDLEKQVVNLNKQVELYKGKLATLAIAKEGSKSDDTAKEELRKLTMMNNQLKNQAEQAKRESARLQEKYAAEFATITSLKSEKQRLELQLRKMTHEQRIAEAPVVNNALDAEMKKLTSQNQLLESQGREMNMKNKELERKLAEAIKGSKAATSSGPADESLKVKAAYLETSLKKLTGDLNESRNMMGEMKKEVNKLRQDKVSLQNTLDKLRKDAAKPAAPKIGKAS